MTVERKFIDLKSLKVSDEGPGYIEGYRSVHSVIDEGGDLIVPGAFKDCIPEYLSSGFTAHSHEWNFSEAVGFPVEAYEDGHGWFVKSQFHSTADAQAIRTKAKERMDAGKQVGFSFGYAPTEYTHIEAKDYETELAKYVTPENLAATLQKAQKFNRVRILKKVEAIEDSLVTAPMNKRAAATAVKSEDKPTEEKQDSPVDPPAGKTFEEHSQSVLAAVSELTHRAKEINEIRTKEGRTLSAVNRSRLSNLLASLKTAADDIETFLAETEPPPKEKGWDSLSIESAQLHLRARAALALEL